ncbi:MAG: DEAD/DEAH box helicase family protein [Prevotella sp.]|nr:DEAD/DEAH box helicase family protein [Prevotella sp.]
MLQEAKDLQQRAVAELLQKADGNKKVLTFRAPTGSGKTRMMADFMNQVLTAHDDVVFLVSTLSKGNLAQQNYDVFRDCADKGIFPKIDAYLISTEVSGEETLFIPENHNVYVLPRDLFKKNGRLMQGPMLNFLRTITEDYFGKGKNKRIFLIKDECHQATNNLDAISEDFFKRIFNFSATPKLSRGQVPDVQITDDEAVQAKLIKRVELVDDDSVPVETALEKFQEIKQAYRNLLGVNPCLIIQISNKDKAEDEWNTRIKPALDKHQDLKWMVIVDKSKLCDTNDDIKKKLPVERWKDYAKGNESTIDVIVFKMVISEGWDIPRACMLYQVRDTQSRQLDEQVMGRVRRNPRLLDFERLSDEAKELAMTAWVWGIEPEGMKQMHPVRLWKSDSVNLQDLIKIKTTRLTNLKNKKGFKIEDVVQPDTKSVHTNIFTLYNKLTRVENELQDLCFEYAHDDVSRWWTFMEQIDKIKKQYDTYICNYEESMEVDKETTFPAISSYVDNGNHNEQEDWVWCRRGNSTTFAFDSEAERKWASVLGKLAIKCGDKVRTSLFEDDYRYLWGKNFPHNSDIKYEYYLNGIHSSYPDFILKDYQGRIHIFEVKSVNHSGTMPVDEAEYERKVNELKECYRASSALLPDHVFYLPILKDDDWNIFKFEQGNATMTSLEEIRRVLSTN